MVNIYWNHRVMRRRPDPERSPDLYHLFIVEVYYNNEDHSIMGWTEEESVWGDEEWDGVEGLRQTLHWMLDATEKPVLDEEILLAQAEEYRASHPNPEPEEYEVFDDLDAFMAALEEVDPGLRERVEELSEHLGPQIEEEMKKWNE